MPLVWIPSQLLDLCAGLRQVRVPGRTVAEVIANLDADCPGIAARLLDGDRLVPEIAVSVDGAVSTLGLLEPVEDRSEVFFVPAIQGG
jgi:hypothetical protein